MGVAFQGLGGESQNVGYIIPADIAKNFLRAIATSVDGSYVYRGVQEVPFRWAKLQNKSLRRFLRFGGTSGVVVTKVSPLAAAAAEETGQDFLRRDDVITHIDGAELGDDYTVPLREDRRYVQNRWVQEKIIETELIHSTSHTASTRSEFMNADFLITGKKKGEPTTFDIIRESKSLRITSVLGPLTPNAPRDHGVDCTPEWLVIGGLLFVPLTCPLLRCVGS